MPTIYDNIEKLLLQGLSDCLKESYRSDFCVGYFNLRGWRDIADKIEDFSGEENEKCRLLVGMQKLPEEFVVQFYSSEADFQIDNQTALELKTKLARSFKEQLTYGIPTDQDERGLRQLARQLKSGKVVVKLFLKHHLHAKLYLAFRNDKFTPIIGYVGSSNLTFAGLSKQGELNVDVLEQDAANKLANWFEDRWNDRYCLDITQELIKIIEESWASEELIPPYYIYLKMVYHLSNEARAGLNEYDVPLIFRDKLLPFQQEAVRIAARHLDKRGGVLIGDVVGLGKTITAAALVKLYEENQLIKTLIICPPTLVPMWEDYKQEYDLKADVISLGVVLNKLPQMRKYKLVVIDESHNLRNEQGGKYKIIKDYIREYDSRVILLSATPYNKTYLDLGAQLGLFIDDEQDLGVTPESYIRHLGGVHKFRAKHQTQPNTLLAFEKSYFSDDWRELMKLYLVRRTRSFIKGNYAIYDEKVKRHYLLFENGDKFYFPERVPIAFTYDFDPNNPNDQYAKLYSEEVVDVINSLHLARYGLKQYVDEDKLAILSDEETHIIENLTRAGRRLVGFARTNLFKRLESSGHSFLLSLARHIIRNYLFLYAIENELPIPIGQQEQQVLDSFLNDSDTDVDDDGNTWILSQKQFEKKAVKLYEELESEHFVDKFKWINSTVFLEILKRHIEEDTARLHAILSLGKEWDPAKDSQLNGLFELCTNKHKKEKILIFTQYADTAEYLFSELKNRGVKGIEKVSGASANPTHSAHRFSPKSNNKEKDIDKDDEIRVLIATDVLSEGQNLQDSHIVVNYDLPWAIIRLIQRAGRVDRIGQKSKEILCYSVLPENGLENILNLRSRLTHRIRENSEVIGSDEVFFEGDPISLENLYTEKSGILDDEDDNDVDPTSYAYQIWKDALEKKPELDKIIKELPNVVYSTKELELKEDLAKDGVVVYIRTAQDNDVLIWKDEHGNLVSQSQIQILKAIACEPDTPALEKLTNHHQIVEKAVSFVQENEPKLGGQLGKKNGARYKTYTRLDEYYNHYKDTLFVNDELKKAMEDIYNHPLKEAAREILNRRMKEGIKDENFVELVIALREEGRLVQKMDDENSGKKKIPQIICSMGLKTVN